MLIDLVRQGYVPYYRYLAHYWCARYQN